MLDRAGGRYGLRARRGGPAEAASRLQARAPERGLSPRRSRRSPWSPTCSRSAGPRSRASAASRPTRSSPGCSSASLIEEAGRGDGLGAPVLYRTTTTFERIFGLEEGLDGLPRLDGDDELDSAELRQRLHAVAAERGLETSGPTYPAPVEGRPSASTATSPPAGWLAARVEALVAERPRDDRRRRRATLRRSACPRARTSRSTGARRARAHAYVLLHKPAGVVTTVRDTHGRRTVVDLVGAEPALPRRPARRRHDRPAPAHERRRAGARLMHPRHGVEKTYEATVRRRRRPETAGSAGGRRSSWTGGRTAPARVRVLRPGAAERRRDRPARGPQAPGAAHVRGGRPPRALAAPLGLRRPAPRCALAPGAWRRCARRARAAAHAAPGR